MITAATPNSLLLTTLHQGITARLHLGCQLIALLDGHPVIDIALGTAALAADSLTHTDLPMTPSTLMLWLSAGKPITAAAILMLVERGLLTLDTPVAHVIPEFAANGKDILTLRHLLTHTAGLRGLDLEYPFATWEETLAKIYNMKIERDWIPGHKAGYHAHTTWYLLGEMINRLTHTPHDHWIRTHLLEPLSMTDTYLAMDAATAHTYTDRLGTLYDTSKSSKALTLAPKPLGFDTPLALSRPRPAASCRGPMRDLARFYEMLRNHGTLDGVQILHPDTVSLMTARQRTGMFDTTFRQKIDWGLGVILNSSQYGSAIPYQFGPHASPDTFGHGGSQSSSAFCDPDRRLVVALLFNGCPGEPAHDKRLRATLKTLYEELGLA